MYAGKIIETGTAQDIYHNPQHPYTLALLNSIPRMDQPRQDKLDPVEGQPPDLTQLDNGCSFRYRCRYALDSCAKAFPDQEQVSDGHSAACFEKGRLQEPVKEVS
jgi:oligopeptide/dipeptide ABC transporter ATP-binding protein